MTLTEFLLDRIVEDEVAAKPLNEWPLRDDLFVGYEDESGVWRHGKYDPARVLAECEAKKRIVAFAITFRDNAEQETDAIRRTLAEAMAESAEDALKSIGLVYADHPDYDEAWRP